MTNLTTCFYPLRRGKRTIRRSWYVSLCPNSNGYRLSRPCTTPYSYGGQSRGPICRILSMLYTVYLSNDRSLPNRPRNRERRRLQYDEFPNDACYYVWKGGPSRDDPTNVYNNICHKRNSNVCLGEKCTRVWCTKKDFRGLPPFSFVRLGVRSQSLHRAP